ncbi:hypothetical protein Rsub_05896 [Raphidocelis subcapitata]|uniref:Protein kinase domain-containing protein n=1 Tax=Raphidocelis subcapitata TaxID=307507 RepID=A0A2V0P7U6_9CHLO|nr:hypothetical protein Rsub_05896 [Raphidocelis subcapitata]|eukprot:GBF93165.1 hypothetical protein Rsub_05896 [Raphidocelis subcapitata]
MGGCAPSRPVAAAAAGRATTCGAAACRAAAKYVAFVPAACPLNEPGRLARLKGLDILDTAPIALVSVVDAQRQWFKAAEGLGGVCQTGRSESFCAWTLLPQYPEALVVEDTLADARFAENPLVTGFPFIRSYMGCPLIAADGARLGTLCVIDRVPRLFDAESCALLANIAEIVARELDKNELLPPQPQPPPPPYQAAASFRARRRTQDARQPASGGPVRGGEALRGAMMVVDASGAEPSWRLAYADAACQRLLGGGGGGDVVAGAPLWDLVKAVDAAGRPAADPAAAAAAAHAALTRAAEEHRDLELRVAFASPGGARRLGLLQFRLSQSGGADAATPLIGIPSSIPWASPGHQVPGFYCAALHDCGPAAASGAGGGGAAAGAGFGQAGRTSAPAGGGFEDIRLGPLCGRGSFGRVYRATWNGEKVAVKIIEYEAEDEGTAAAAAKQPRGSDSGESDGGGGGACGARVLLEGLLQQRLDHPNVVRSRKLLTRPCPDDDGGDGDGDEGGGGSADAGAGVRGGRPRLMEAWLVLEYCDQGSLAEAVERGRFRRRGSGFEPWPRAVVATAREVAEGMAYLHAEGLLHGDLSAANILLASPPPGAGDARGFVAKVSDLGLSRLVPPGEGGFVQTRTYGTVTHQPHEVLVEGRTSKAADVYSFAVCVWEMLSGCRPYAGQTHAQVLHAAATGHTLGVPSATPAPMRPLLARALDPRAEVRPTFPEMLQGLRRLEEAFPW